MERVDGVPTSERREMAKSCCSRSPLLKRPLCGGSHGQVSARCRQQNATKSHATLRALANVGLGVQLSHLVLTPEHPPPNFRFFSIYSFAAFHSIPAFYSPSIISREFLRPASHCKY